MNSEGIESDGKDLFLNISCSEGYHITLTLNPHHSSGEHFQGTADSIIFKNFTNIKYKKEQNVYIPSLNILFPKHRWERPGVL
jgi:hypothetical protein